MPYIETETTVNITNEQKTALKEAFGRDIELIPGKSEAWLMLKIEGGCYMAFGGKTEPGAAMVKVSLLGKATREVYDSLTAKICEDVSRILDIPTDRIYVNYAEYSTWGHDGYNF